LALNLICELNNAELRYYSGGSVANRRHCGVRSLVYLSIRDLRQIPNAQQDQHERAATTTVMISSGSRYYAYLFMRISFRSARLLLFRGAAGGLPGFHEEFLEIANHARIALG
jgi:hypothetical protein